MRQSLACWQCGSPLPLACSNPFITPIGTFSIQTVASAHLTPGAPAAVQQRRERVGHYEDMVDIASTANTASTVNVVATADVHINGGRWGGVNPETGRTRSSEHTYGIWLSICERAVAERAVLLLCGDLFLDGHPRPEDVEMLADGIRLVANAGLETVIVRGNHDPRHLPLGQRDPLGRYGDLPGVNVVDTPRVVRLASGLSVVGLPWPRSVDYLEAGEAEGLGTDDVDLLVAGRAMERLEELIEEAASYPEPIVVAAHCTVDAAMLGSARRGSEVVLGKLLHEPVLALSVFEDPRVTHAAIGHIHRRQQMTDGVWYCGSPDRIDFGEEDQDKAFSLVRIPAENEGCREEGETLIGKAEVESVKVDARQFRTIDIGAGTNSDDIDGLIAGLVGDVAGYLVRLRIDGRCEVSETALRKAVTDAGGQVVQVVVIPPPDQARSAAALEEEIGPIDGLRRWLEEVSGEDPATWADLIADAEVLCDEVATVGGASDGGEVT